MKLTDGSAILKVGTLLCFPKKFLSKASFHFSLWARKEAKKILLARTKLYAEVWVYHLLGCLSGIRRRGGVRVVGPGR